MKIIDTRKDAADDQTGEVESGRKRTYQTGKDCQPKITLTIEYVDGMDMAMTFSRAEEFIHKIEEKDQTNLFGEGSKVA